MERQMCVAIRSVRLVAALAASTLVLSGWLSPAWGASAKEIDADVDKALVQFEQEVKNAKSFLDSSKGVLVFPNVLKAGLAVGGEYGEGALRIGGKTVDYYNTAAASFGLQAGGQIKTVIIAFLDADALQHFRESKGWKAGVDGSIAVVTLGAGGAIDTTKLNEPIVGFAVDQKGLMANLTFEGSKFTKLDKKT